MSMGSNARFRALRAAFLEVLVLFCMTYVGLITGANKGDMLNLGPSAALSEGKSRATRRSRFSTPA